MRSKAILVIFVSLFVFSFVFWYFNQENKNVNMINKNSGNGIIYVPIGDSYTIGYGVNEDERWPNVLTENLRKEGIDINLVSNPSVSGYTTRDVIYFELPEVKRAKPDFVTVLIGANDSFSQKEVSLYQKDLAELLDKLEEILPNPKNIVLITIPDYSVSVQAAGFPKNELVRLISQYNNVIKKEANKRGLMVADIFPVSKNMTKASDYTPDGLHPSAVGYLKWERVIFPVVFDLLKDK